MNHIERVNYVEEQISLGKTNDQIIAMIKKEQWKDFNESISRRQIDMVRNSRRQIDMVRNMPLTESNNDCD